MRNGIGAARAGCYDHIMQIKTGWIRRELAKESIELWKVT